MYPLEFQELKDCFKELPGVGDKSAERYVYAIDELDDDNVKKIADSLIAFKKNIRKCNICGCLSNQDICSVCSSDMRDKSTICVVEDSKSAFAFESTGKYKGLYHILGGLISPIDEINPEDINISSLVTNRLNSELKEVIIALNSSVEGEMTSLYIQKLLEGKGVKVSRLAYGLPMNADIEYLDPLTIIRAIDDRKFLS